MTKLFSIFILALLITGCSYKNQSINLQPYQADISINNSQEKKSVYIKTVKDLRTNKISIGSVIKDNEDDISLFSDESFEKEYKEKLTKAFKNAQFITNTDILSADLVIEVYIEKIELIYNKNISFDKNLNGEIQLTTIVYKNEKKIRQNFKQSASKWLANSHNSKDIEPFLNEMFSQSVNRVVSRLTRY